jgi:hypothetical protein
MNPQLPTWDRDICQLFRKKDVESMAWKFDLSSYDDVRSNADDIYAQVAQGTMPCDGPWTPQNVQRFGEWIDAGAPR